ncbi:hypothetical protein [Robertkochia aurantiaca]|uniref:hypothetical protein n=1 Tax=Robertkochia aurantiaca TaxID=2873700 RepID=UPI001CCD4141|nr:hypothetical protein [Robertkochia sp. 3YJGBD-33]
MNFLYSKNFLSYIAHYSFLIILNSLITGVFAFLTLDANANLNSRAGAFLLAYLVPFFISSMFREMNRTERVLKFGTGLIICSLVLIFTTGIMTMISTTFLPCVLLVLLLLFYGDLLLLRC